MATKPTDRILDWASGGTATDPGGTKEAAGWLVSERPPAYWWNWILNSFGQWLSWFNTTGTPRVACRINTGPSPVIQWEGVIGPTIDTITYTGSEVNILFDDAFIATTNESCTVAMTLSPNSFITGATTGTQQIDLECFDSDDTQVNLSTTVRVIQIVVYGEAP